MTTIRTVARRPLGGSSADDPRVVQTQADLRESAARRALAGVDVLYHLGFALWRERDAVHLNRDGTRNILAGRPVRVVLASSAAVYGAWPDNPKPLTEDHWPRPNRQCQYAVDKLRAERLCQDAAPTVSLRIAAVLGPNADPRVTQAVQGYRWVVPAITGRRAALQFVDEDDAADALHRAGGSTATGPLNIAPGDWLTPRQVARVSGGYVLPVPERLLLAAAEGARQLRLTPFGADRAVLINGPLALDASRAATSLGWRATKTSAEVLAAALRSRPVAGVGAGPSARPSGRSGRRSERRRPELLLHKHS